MSVPPPPAQGEPYPGQPGQPDPYGPPPGQPGQYGPPPGQPGAYGPGYAPAPLPPPKKRRLWLKIGLPILVVFLLGIGAVAVIGFNAVKKSPLLAEAGDCLNVKEFATITADNQPVKVDCADPTANLKVAVKIAGTAGACPADGYVELSIDQPASRICLIPNAKQGDCFANFPDGAVAFTRVACTDPTAKAEFVKVAPVNDRNQCEGTQAESVLSYPTPPTTFCFKAKG